MNAASDTTSGSGGEYVAAVARSRILRRIRRLIQEEDYVISIHARDETVLDRLTAEDVESRILTELALDG